MYKVYSVYNDRKPDLERLYLAHHGIKGMKWGVRRTPEQLGHRRSAKGKSLDNRRAGMPALFIAKKVINTAYEAGDAASEKLKESGNEEMAKTVDSGMDKLNRMPIPDLNIAREIALGAGAAVLAPVNPIAAAGVGGVAAVCMASRLRNAGRSIVRTAAYYNERESAPVDPKTGLKKKTRELTSEEDMKRVNPMYGDALKGSKNNCMACSMAYDMRRRGYEVRATKLNFGLKGRDIQEKYYKDSVFSGGLRASEAFKQMKSQPDGARGAVLVQWTLGGAHAMGYEVQGGKVTIIDAQTSKRYSEKSFMAKSILGVSSMGYTRLDNCTPDIEALRRDILE